MMLIFSLLLFSLEKLSSQELSGDQVQTSSEDVNIQHVMVSSYVGQTGWRQNEVSKQMGSTGTGGEEDTMLVRVPKQWYQQQQQQQQQTNQAPVPVMPVLNHGQMSWIPMDSLPYLFASQQQQQTVGGVGEVQVSLQQQQQQMENNAMRKSSGRAWTKPNYKNQIQVKRSPQVDPSTSQLYNVNSLLNVNTLSSGGEPKTGLGLKNKPLGGGGMSELDRAERMHKSLGRLIQMVNIAGQVDNYLSTRMKTFARTVANLYGHPDD